MSAAKSIRWRVCPVVAATLITVNLIKGVIVDDTTDKANNYVIYKGFDCKFQIYSPEYNAVVDRDPCDNGDNVIGKVFSLKKYWGSLSKFKKYLCYGICVVVLMYLWLLII